MRLSAIRIIIVNSVILDEPEPMNRRWGTAASVAIGAWLGADVVRVHDVKEMRDVVRVVKAIKGPEET